MENREREVIAAGILGAILTTCTVFLLASVSFLPCADAYAADAPTVQRQTVRVGFFSFDGYHMISDDGTRSGYGYELIQDLARYNDWDVKYVGYDKSWSEMQEMLADGEIDLLTSAQMTPARAARFDFSTEDVGTSSTMLTVKSGNEKIIAQSYATYNGMRIGMIEGNSRNDDLSAFAAEKGFTFTPVYFDSIAELQDALQNGDVIDAALTSSLRSTKNEWIIDEFDSSPFYVMVKKGDSALLDQVNTAITQLDLDRPSWRTDLANRYYTTDNGDELLFSSEERAYLKQLSDEGIVFKVAVNPDNSPYSYFVDGQAAGVLPTVFAEIAEKTGIDYEIMPTTTRAEYEDAISSRQADIIIDATCSLYEAEESGYKLDDSYASLTLSQLTRRNRSGDIATVCLPADIARAIGVTEGKPSGGSITYSIVDSTQACVDGVLAGTYDAAYLYTYTARQYMNDDERNSLTMFLLPDYSVPMALAVSAQLDTRLTTILDKASHSVSQRASDILLAQGEETAEGPISFIGLLYDHPVGVIGVVALLGTLLLLVLVLLFRAHAAKLERNRRVELERSEQALSGALEKARAANDAKSTFLSNMSHDMRTPLNGILGFSELALKTDDTAARQAYLEKIESSGKLMLGLVNDTLDLSKIESGKMTLEPEDADARELFDGIVDSVRVSADEKHITFIADIANADFGIVHVDRLRMQQVFLNLLSNAIKYTPDGGTVWFTVRHLDQPIDGCNYLSTVRDNGIGMGAEFLPHVFEAFSQEHAKESRNVTGTGLGLSIVSKIVELMGGRISVESAKGEGTTFDVYLPVEIVDSAARAADADRLPQVDLTGKHILLCEDNRLNAEISETLLAERGLSVEKAWDGKECVEKFETSPVGAYDAILMDLRMPIMDGYAAAQAIRALERPDAATVPIIAMSADAYTDDVRHCLDVGMNSHVSKPVDPERLFAELARLCG